MSVFKFTEISGCAAVVVAMALCSAPMHAAEAKVSSGSLIPAPPPLPWARDELVEPAVLKSKNGLLDVLMIAHPTTVSIFPPLRTEAWTYDICQRPSNGSQNCPKAKSAEAEYGGTRLQIDPGDTLRVRLINRLPIFILPFDPDSPVNPAVGRSLNQTSLHVHGLLVSPHAAIAGQSVWGDDPFVRVFNLANGKAPDFEKMMGPVVYTHIDYSYNIPGTHPAGLFWFHPHAHGLAQPQITSGLAGVLTIGHVADEICGNAASCKNELMQVPQRELILKDSQINSQGAIALDEDTGFCAVDNSPGSTSRSHQGGCDGTTKSPVSGIDRSGGRWVYSINGQVYPSITVGVPQGQIWRITNASPNTTYDLNLWLPDEKRQMTMQVLSIDGVNVGTKQQGATQPDTCYSPFGLSGVCTTRLHLMPASRAEIWVAYRDENGVPRWQPKPTQAILRTAGYETGPDGDNFPAIDLAKVSLAYGQVAMQGDGAVSVRNGKPDLLAEENASVAKSAADTGCTQLATGHMRRIFFNQFHGNVRGFGLGFEEIDENGRSVPGTFHDIAAFDHSNPELCLQLAAGNQPEVERWQLVNLAGEDHNFHIHQVRFTVLDAPQVDGTIAPKRIGLKHEVVDSVPLPHADGNCETVDDWRLGRCKVHIATVQIPFTIAGDFVYHCHILEHEDGGMMAKIHVAPNDAKAVSPAR